MKMPKFLKMLWILTFISIFIYPTFLIAGEIQVIANKGVPDAQLSKEDVKAIFLGEKTKWSNDSKVVFAILKAPDDQEKFMKDFVGKTPSQFNNFWKQQVFTGKGKMPDAFDDSKGVIDFVAKTEGAIAYVSSDAPADNVKKLEVK